MRKISEKNVASLWESGRLSRFTDDMGNRVEVICPGRASSGPGRDFTDAVIVVNDEKLVGDIELHVTSDLWQKHRHHINPAYNSIVLHVALWKGGKLPVRLQAGVVVPTIILSSYISKNALTCRRYETDPPGCPRVKTRSDVAKALPAIVNAGIQRFTAKAEKYTEALDNLDPEQVLYKGICRALGYSHNTEPFEALADFMPLQRIMKIARGSSITKQAVLIGAAGLLPSQHSPSSSLITPEIASRLEREWEGLDKKPCFLRSGAWRLSCLRPANHPLKRLMYLGYVLDVYGSQGLVHGITGAPSTCLPADYAELLERRLQLNQDLHLIGRGRVREIIVNQVLPFILAYAQKEKTVNLSMQAIYAYLTCGYLPANELSRYMQRQLNMKGMGRISACVQQGLLHIFHSYCRVKECAVCPIPIIRTPDRV